MVNAGALATTNLVRGEDPAEKLERTLKVLRCYAGNERLEVHQDTFRAEMRTADRNRATAYLMRSVGMLAGDVETILALYLQQCSVLVTCRELAVMAATVANGGTNPITGEQALDPRYARDVLSVMHTCSVYDFAGQWAYQVGIPAKMGIAVFSPGLDVYGNSVRGIRVCEEISARLGLHVFATGAGDSMLGPA
jgi:glutaminase